MIQRRSRFCLTDKTIHPIFVFRKLRRQNFQRDLAIEFLIFGEENFAIPPALILETMR